MKRKKNDYILNTFREISIAMQNTKKKRLFADKRKKKKKK